MLKKHFDFGVVNNDIMLPLMHKECFVINMSLSHLIN